MSAPGVLARKAAALQALGFRRAVDPEERSESVPVGGGRHKVTCVRPSMGTLVSVTGIHDSSDRVQTAAGLAFEEMDRIVALLNRYDSDSAVSCLNHEGTIRGAPPELTKVLGRALSHHAASGGAFDPTVQPVVDFLRDGGEDGPALDHVVSLVGAERVRLDGRAVRFAEPGMGITLDGIAKGWVVDRMADVLSAHGLGHFLINAGGDIRARGAREDGEPWRVGVQDPAGRGRLPDVVALSGMAVATSGGYEIYFDAERTRHHIVTPRTGTSPQHMQSASVIAPTAADADALATSLLVLEPGAGLSLIESLPGCACLLVDRDGRSLRSTRWRDALANSPSSAGSP